jgi:lipoic acid synthetase
MKRSIGETYLKLSAKLGEPSELSLRKQFCLQYLKWGFSTQPKDKEEFVELAAFATETGFAGVMSGPLVRSSYRAGRLYKQAMEKKAAANNNG